MQPLKDVRLRKDDFFAHHEQSPLTAAQKAEFQGLDYFPENPELRLEVDVKPLSTRERVVVQTTGGQPQTYERFGRFAFTVEGTSAELTIYRNEHGYFLPFVDRLAGKATYPAGRYLDPERLANGKFMVDFNLAYNPYCAYNEKWSCPITPAENRLQVGIRAGERLFKHEIVEGDG